MNIAEVSIGVPVFNAEKYLSQCVESLLTQTLYNIEIILVNDGSTDSSEDICKHFAEQDSRIKYIFKTNGGLASARQAALEASTGKYFCTCDADDWTEPSMYEDLYKNAIETGADIVMCDYISEYGNNIAKDSCYGKDVPNDIEQIVDDALNGRFPCSVWSKMFKRDIFEKYSLEWEPGINMGEDFLMTLKILQHPMKISYLPKPLYHYRRIPGENSYTNKVTLNSYNQMLRIQDWVEGHFERKRYVKGINHYLINIAFAGLRVDEGMTAEYYINTSIKRLRVADLVYERTLKSMVILWTKILGYKAGVGLYRLMYNRVYK